VIQVLFLFELGQYVETIRQKASRFFICFWVHCCKEANVVAHILARETSSKCLFNCWIEEMPSFISVVSYRDSFINKK
jgi:hypothetical protein